MKDSETNIKKVSEDNESATTHATLNKLRAAVLGANDGIVSTSSVVMGVAGATTDKATIFTAGMAALVAGALSMAVGEYVSVSSQSDAEKASVRAGKREPGHITSPSQAAIASFLSFSVGGIIPFLTITLVPQPVDLYYTVIAVLLALIFTGYFSAKVGNAPKLRAVTRVVVGGMLAMGITYLVGKAFGGIY